MEAIAATHLLNGGMVPTATLLILPRTATPLTLDQEIVLVVTVVFYPQMELAHPLQLVRLASVWLRLKGYKVLDQRYKTPHGEIDLVVNTSVNNKSLC